MRLSILILLLIATLFGSAFWFAQLDPICRTPVRYYIAEVDPRFGTSKEEMKRIALAAESIWEDRLNTELFVYDEAGDLPVNLIFDERQENAELENEIREDLEAKAGMSENVAKQYEKLISEFRTLKRTYESEVVAYETSLRAYNTKVSDWNEKGGAPEPILSELRDEESDLKKKQRSLESRAKELNALVTELNRIGARGNSLITDYNTIVEAYNDRFSEVKEFAQGDYTGDAINIYQFDAEDDLIIVLAHEFGHALSIDHVDNESSFMYHHMKNQSLEQGLTSEDVDGYTKVCSSKGIVDHIKNIFLSP